MAKKAGPGIRREAHRCIGQGSGPPGGPSLHEKLSSAKRQSQVQRKCYRVQRDTPLAGGDPEILSRGPRSGWPLKDK